MKKYPLTNNTNNLESFNYNHINFLVITENSGIQNGKTSNYQ